MIKIKLYASCDELFISTYPFRVGVVDFKIMLGTNGVWLRVSEDEFNRIKELIAF